MKEMKVGDKAFLYHSNCKIPGIAGTASPLGLLTARNHGNM